MNYQRFRLPLLAFSSTLLLSACGGGGGSSNDDEVTRQLVEVNSAKVSLQPLKSSSATSFANHLKNGLYTSSISQFESCANCTATPSTTQAGDAASGYSSTNVQEAGVDEADRIKYDGDYLYMAARSYYNPLAGGTAMQSDYVKIMKRQPDTTMEEVAVLTPQGALNSMSGLYLHSDKLTVVGHSSSWYDIMPIDVWHPFEQKVEVEIYDVATPEQATMNNAISFDGYLLSSRRIDNKVYVVSSFSPKVEGINYGAHTDADKQANFDLIRAIDVNTLMPKLTKADNTVHNLVDPQSCFIPEDAGSSDGYDSIVTLTTIDLSQPDNIESVCINAVTQGLYASSNAIYLMATDNFEQSVIHKFDLGNALDYVGAGTVDGYFGWSNPSFRLSEYQNTLRVVTSNFEAGEIKHNLYVLNTQPQDNKLNIISQLPNDLHPEPIGKPGEDIYAVRYFEDKAYIVTYLRIDPLYVLDLADASNPKIAGELEVPGFSSYLHPINDNLLLGIGQQVDPNRLPGNGEVGTANTTPIDEGAKVSLFDVSDPANPLELGTVVYPNGYTPVEWDHHALTYIKMTDNEHRFALPVSSWYINAEGGWEYGNSLQLLEVNITDNGGELVDKSALQVDNLPQDYSFNGGQEDRSIIHADTVYYIHGNEIWQGLWK